ncbi:Dual specificity protein phosphatase 16 [Pelomyxa schiedti]|nr:Dual specificity protein phosphatase 16 [Pelomyxa schiedti]
MYRRARPTAHPLCTGSILHTTWGACEATTHTLAGLTTPSTAARLAPPHTPKRPATVHRIDAAHKMAGVSGEWNGRHCGDQNTPSELGTQCSFNECFESEAQYKLSRKRTTWMSIINEYIVLAGAWDATLHNLKKWGITHILNVKGGSYWHTPGLTEAIIPISDFGTDTLTPILDKCFSFINEARNSHGRVLVHCSLGVNRSPTVVIAYLMCHCGMTLQQAYTHVLGKRNAISPHELYFIQLQQLDERLYGRVSFTEKDRNGSLQEYMRSLRVQQTAQNSTASAPSDNSS